MARAKAKHWQPHEDDLLSTLVARGVSHRQIGQLVGRSKQAVGARAHILRRGLKKRPWSPAEDALIRDTAGWRTAESIGAELGRTPEAVSDRASILGIHWWSPDRRRVNIGHTGTQVAKLLGVACSKTVTDWIDKGYLVASRRAPRLGEHNYKIAYRVMPDALRNFLREFPWLYDRERIADRGWAAWVAHNVPRERWVGTREAADLLCMTEANVCKIIRLGDLRAEKLGPNWVIAESWLRAYVPPPIGWGRYWDKAVQAEIAARRAANLAARRSVCFKQTPEAVARMEAGRRARRAAKAHTEAA